MPHPATYPLACLNLTTEQAIAQFCRELQHHPHCRHRCDAVHYRGWTYGGRRLGRVHHFELMEQGRPVAEYSALHCDLVWLKNRRPFRFHEWKLRWRAAAR